MRKGEERRDRESCLDILKSGTRAARIATGFLTYNATPYEEE